MPAFEQLLNAIDEPVVELDLAGRIVFATPSAKEWLQLNAGDEFIRSIPVDDQSRYKQALKRVGEGKIGSMRVEVNVGTDDASLIPAELKLSGIAREGAKPTAVGVWLRDLTLERASEVAANVQGTHLLDLVENVSDACVVEGADGTIEMVNDAFCHLFNIDAAAQSLIGTLCATLFEKASLTTERQIGPIYFPLDAGMGSNGDGRDELPFHLADGQSITQVTLAVEGQVGIAGRLHVFHRANLTAANVAVDPAEAAIARARAQTIDAIARELVVTVESAGSAMHRAEQLELSEQVLGQFRRVDTSANKAIEAVATLIDFTKLDSTQITLDHNPFRLRESLAAMIDRVAQQAEIAGIDLRVRVEQDVPEKLVGDGPRLVLALRNLIDSILYGSPVGHHSGDRGGEILLTVSPEYAAESLIHLIFSVEHQLPKGELRHRVSPATSAMRLGLARPIVRALAEQVAGEQNTGEKTSRSESEGKIEIVERKAGTEYRFSAAFPFERSGDPRQRPTFVTLTSLPALIVSADQAERKNLADLMKSWRMLPREADNATMALQLLNRMADEDHPIPLVITSNNLPIQDGFVLAFRIRNTPKLKTTSVLMLATNGKPGDAIQCRESGISVYLRQPLAPEQLNEALLAVIGSKEDAPVDATLITRHSLREAKRGSVLVIDADRDQSMLVAAGLKKRDYRVSVVTNAPDAYHAMAQEEFNVIVVDPENAGFDDIQGVLNSIRAHVGRGRKQPHVLLATESPPSAPSAFDGMVLKPYAKDSLVNAIADLTLPAS
jgi:DNA-binding response OmpR family regulator/PAS domain-containing protein